MNTTIAPNHLIILGNGFDLAHGMKTSYADFIQAMIVDNYTAKREYLQSPFALKEEQRVVLQEANSTSTSTLLSYYLPDFKKSGNHNSFLATLLDDFSNKGWVDLEEAYYRELGRLKDDREQIASLNKTMELLALSLEQYLTKVEAEEVAWDERIYSRLAWVDGRFLSFVSLSSFFKEVKRRKSYPEIEENLKHMMQNFRNTRGGIMVLNFNYTNTINMYLTKDVEQRLSDVEVINIHGRLGERNIILGYGDEASDLYRELENANDNELTKHFKSFYYAQSEQYRDLFAFLDSGEFRVHLMGHSCGLSDRVLLSAVFQHTNLEAVKLYYHDKGNGTDDFLERTQNISRHFKDKHRFRLKLLPKKNKAKKGVVNTNYSVPLVKQDDN